MPEETRVPLLDFAPEVTKRHGIIFAKLFLAAVATTEVPGDALSLTGVMDWPSGNGETPAQWRHDRISDEIMRRILDQIEEPLKDAFTSIAREVIARERQLQADGE